MAGRGRPPKADKMTPAARQKAHRVRQRKRLNTIQAIIEGDEVNPIDFVLPPPKGWLNSDEHGMKGLVRVVDWRRWDPFVELATVFGETERALVEIDFVESEPGVLLLSDQPMPKTQLQRLAGGCMSIMCLMSAMPCEGWWWIDLFEEDGILKSTPRMRALSYLQASALAAHPHPEVLA